MILDIIVTFVSGLAVISNSCMRGQITANNRFSAQSLGNPYYVDGDRKRRGTDTKEILADSFATGHHQLVGTCTGKVYKDWHQDKINEKNDKLLRKGKTRFKYVDYPQWKDKHGRRILIRYDVQKNMPYMCLIPTNENIYKTAGISCKYSMAYITNMNGNCPTIDFSTRRELTKEEYEQYTDKETASELHIGRGWK